MSVCLPDKPKWQMSTPVITLEKWLDIPYFQKRFYKEGFRYIIYSYSMCRMFQSGCTFQLAVMNRFKRAKLSSFCRFARFLNYVFVGLFSFVLLLFLFSDITKLILKRKQTL